ncbi:glycosyltransferase [Mongoliitalea lutea]|nr:glycosyltransferase [Mongoliitalea lutea]
MPYTVAVLNSLIRDFDTQIILVYWDQKKLTPFVFDFPPSVLKLVPRSSLSELSDCALLFEFNPDLIVTSGRMDKLYLNINLEFKKKGVPRVMNCDNQWENTWRQRLKSFLGYPLYRKYFNYCWVPGSRQYLFAHSIGFSMNAIIPNFYSASDLFFDKYCTIKEKRILFVGRFAKVKNVEALIQAFTGLTDKFPEWKLRLVGSGVLDQNQIYNKNIEVFSFESQEKLVEHAQESSVFCLPSVHEAWGVVVHEFAALGMPLLLSDKVGASDKYLISNYNGLRFEADDPDSLKEKLNMLMSLSLDQLQIWGNRSRSLAISRTPEISAASLLSVL